ncbi:unnamed protein product [Withania somnifera]
MGIFKEKKNASLLATSPCGQLREAYHNCFNRWYSDKFLKGEWNKEECVIEWKKYRDCLSVSSSLNCNLNLCSLCICFDLPFH